MVGRGRDDLHARVRRGVLGGRIASRRARTPEGRRDDRRIAARRRQFDHARRRSGLRAAPLRRGRAHRYALDRRGRPVAAARAACLYAPHTGGQRHARHRFRHDVRRMRAHRRRMPRRCRRPDPHRAHAARVRARTRSRAGAVRARLPRPGRTLRRARARARADVHAGRPPRGHARVRASRARLARPDVVHVAQHRPDRRRHRGVRRDGHRDRPQPERDHVDHRALPGARADRCGRDGGDRVGRCGARSRLRHVPPHVAVHALPPPAFPRPGRAAARQGAGDGDDRRGEGAVDRSRGRFARSRQARGHHPRRPVPAAHDADEHARVSRDVLRERGRRVHDDGGRKGADGGSARVVGRRERGARTGERSRGNHDRAQRVASFARRAEDAVGAEPLLSGRVGVVVRWRAGVAGLFVRQRR
ncbi:hypothetical protein BCEP4_1930011 [Burkholderia cepacia]|nr:hypothetical protein BCEP4_1930011 [Burkholderia cepacia]